MVQPRASWPLRVADMTTPTTGTSKTIGQPLARKASPKISGLMGKLIANAAVLVLWQIIAISPIADGGLPTPVEVLQAFIGLVGTSTYWVAIGATLRSWAAGLALCAVIGVPVGLLIGSVVTWLLRETAPRKLQGAGE